MGGMDYGDYYWGLYRDDYREPFPHSLLSTRETKPRPVQDVMSEAVGTKLLCGPEPFNPSDTSNAGMLKKGLSLNKAMTSSSCSLYNYTTRDSPKNLFRHSYSLWL